MRPSLRGWITLLGGLAIGALVLVGLAREQRWWTRSFEVRFRTADAGGIWPGDHVTISGYRVGKVERVGLGDDGVVMVDLHLDERFRRLVGQNSRVFSYQESLIGDRQIGLTPDVTPPGEEPARQDLLLPYDPGTDVAALLEELTETRLRLDQTLQGIVAVVEDDLPGAIASFDGTLTDVRRLAGTVDRETGRTASVTRDTLRLYQETGEQLRETSDEATGLLRSGSPEVLATMQEIRRLASGMNGLLSSLAGTLLLQPSGGNGATDSGESPGPGGEPQSPVTEPESDPGPTVPARR
jgi:phospholipid/cholesterol/gamma-HCH transport system substrate-binding protein